MKFGEIGYPVPIPERGHPQTAQGTDINIEAVAFWPIKTDRRLGIGPSSIKQAQHPMMKNVGEPGKGVIIGITQSVAGVLTQMQGQRSLRAKQSQKIFVQPWHLTFIPRREGRQGSRCESQGRFLSQTYRIISQPGRFAQSWLVAIQTLQAAQRLEKIKSVRRALQRLEKGYSVCRRPIRAGHRMISPRSVDLTTVSVKELMEAYLAKNCSSTAPKSMMPTPSNAASSRITVTS